MRKLTLSIFLPLIVGGALSAHAADFNSGNVINCTLEGGGYVQFNADGGKSDIVLDRAARQRLQPDTGVSSSGLAARAELAKVSQEQGYGHFYSKLAVDSDKSCQASIQFQVDPGHGRESVQALAANDAIPLNAQGSANYVRCASHQVRIQSCKAGLDLSSISELGDFFSSAN